jgi:hypothetical protein
MTYRNGLAVIPSAENAEASGAHQDSTSEVFINLKATAARP